MRKNQKYTQEEMYASIERCRKEKITYAKFCRQSGISYATLKYWIDKYDLEQIKQANPLAPSFIPVHAPDTSFFTEEKPDNILVAYPNGVKVSCPVSIAPGLLQTILKP